MILKAHIETTKSISPPTQVRMYGVFEHLTTAIKSYLTADNPGALFGKILQRLEKDFENGDISR